MLRIITSKKTSQITMVTKSNIINGDNLNNIAHKARRHLRNKKWKSLRDKINELATNSKSKNIRDLYRGISEFKRGYRPRSNLVKDEMICLQIPTTF
jgi:hypothetical protein